LTRRTRIQVSLSERALHRLDLLASERGQSRSRAVESLLEAPAAAAGLPSRERALQLLSESAENGSVTARVALARLLAGNQPQPAGERDEVDELRERRLRRVRR
jgi:Ribbon-helix-helix protein, copG family